jgi:hypothetical protein
MLLMTFGLRWLFPIDTSHDFVYLRSHLGDLFGKPLLIARIDKKALPVPGSAVNDTC